VEARERLAQIAATGIGSHCVMAQTYPSAFVQGSIHSRFGRGVLLCDPERFDAFFGRDARGCDLTHRLFETETRNVFTEGIAVPCFDQEYEESQVTVRATDARHSPTGTSVRSSEGWILGTSSGRLVLCSTDALLFWDPNEEDEDPQRYLKLSVPPGWYRVTVLSDAGSDDPDKWQGHVEFVLAPTISKPAFARQVVEDTAPAQVSVPASQQRLTDEESDVASTGLDKNLAKAVLAQFPPSAFELFIKKLFDQDPTAAQSGMQQGSLGEGMFYQPLVNSYGDSLHSVFLLQYLPLKLFRHPQIDQLAEDPTLAPRLKVLKEKYNGKAGYFGMVSPELVKATLLRSIGFLVNMAGLAREDYFNIIIPRYSQLVRDSGLHAPITVVGSYDSFLDLSASKAHELLKEFLTDRCDGISIQLGDEGTQILPYSSQASFESGVLKSNACPYEPIIATASKRNRQLILELEDLIQKGSSEKQLETFLADHVHDIFGGRYDRIEPQIWLRFPELDIAGKERRIDLFMRNSISRDWELFEIKKPISLVREYRDGQTLVAEVANGITQLKRYARLLSAPSIKERLKKSGIEYFEPTLTLVIGRRPNILPEVWRWLLTTHQNDVRLMTYDDILAEMRGRLMSFRHLIDQLSSDPVSS
jgi:hypothetical protein